METTRGFRPRALGEIAVRCADMAAMVTFYEDVIGLERMRGGHRATITFFRVGEGFGGHTSVLALFQHPDTQQNAPVTGPESALHHIALKALCV